MKHNNNSWRLHCSRTSSFHLDNFFRPLSLSINHLPQRTWYPYLYSFISYLTISLLHIHFGSSLHIHFMSLLHIKFRSFKDLFLSPTLKFPSYYARWNHQPGISNRILHLSCIHALQTLLYSINSRKFQLVQ